VTVAGIILRAREKTFGISRARKATCQSPVGWYIIVVKENRGEVVAKQSEVASLCVIRS
jgi:hypothetical protein